MKSYKEGEWMVTTPVYFGTMDDIKKAQVCEHKEYREQSRAVEEGSGMLTIAERCTACVGVRARYRNAK